MSDVEMWMFNAVAEHVYARQSLCLPSQTEV